MPWGSYILHQFRLVPKNALEADFHIPYMKLLSKIFPWNSDYTVVPEYLPRGSCKQPDYVVLYRVLAENKLVLIMELKHPGNLQYNSKCHKADQQIRLHMKELRDECPLPILHGISVFV
ncbi:hypothetical protein H4582DRAFT_1815307 [Lactarius indigo]|nr:hypothetical protein H4582DRAFT_1815307 [Lactarius indigo]